jgi:serine/threonine protein kinase
VVDLTEDGTMDGAVEAAAYRDVFFLNYLADRRVDGERIVPILYDAWIQSRAVGSSLSTLRHRRYFYIVMERFDGDMAHLAHARALHHAVAAPTTPHVTPVSSSPRAGGERKVRALRTDTDSAGAERKAMRQVSAIYTRGELLRMLRIAAQMGVQNGDIKPDQYLYRVDEPDNKGDAQDATTMTKTPAIVITDFGFAGLEGDAKRAALWGWGGGKPAARLGCPTAYEILKGDAAYMNVLILEQSLLVSHPVAVRLPSTPRTRSRRTDTRDYIFGGVRDLDRNSTQNVCSGYTNETVHHLTRDLAPSAIFTFQWKDLRR